LLCRPSQRSEQLQQLRLAADTGLGEDRTVKVTNDVLA
jgi:hypothetical protein